jgi:hypothetical protein
MADHHHHFVTETDWGNNMNIRQFFGLKSPAKTAFTESRTHIEDSSTIADGSAHALRRQLVQVLVRDVMRRHGIPPHWLECQVLVVSSRSRGEGMYVRLVIKHWDLRLLTYAVAFQQSLMLDIASFEPHAAQWLYGISWQLEVGDTCPYPKLPDRSVWAGPSQKTLPASEPKQYLERMFADTDHDIDILIRDAQAAGYVTGAYAKTQPQTLNLH